MIANVSEKINIAKDGGTILNRSGENESVLTLIARLENYQERLAATHSKMEFMQAKLAEIGGAK